MLDTLYGRQQPSERYRYSGQNAFLEILSLGSIMVLIVIELGVVASMMNILLMVNSFYSILGVACEANGGLFRPARQSQSCDSEQKGHPDFGYPLAQDSRGKASLTALRARITFESALELWATDVALHDILRLAICLTAGCTKLDNFALGFFGIAANL
jgi:hypothetical protein